jgi:hypothetical protein
MTGRIGHISGGNQRHRKDAGVTILDGHPVWGKISKALNPGAL